MEVPLTITVTPNRNSFVLASDTTPLIFRFWAVTVSETERNTHVHVKMKNLFLILILVALALQVCLILSDRANVFK